MSESNHTPLKQSSNKDGGYLTLRRAFIDWLIAKDANLVAPFLLLLRKATHVERPLTLNNGMTITLYPLQLVSSVMSLAKTLKIGRNKCKRLVDKLVTLKLISKARVSHEATVYSITDKLLPSILSSSIVDTSCSNMSRPMLQNGAHYAHSGAHPLDPIDYINQPDLEVLRGVREKLQNLPPEVGAALAATRYLKENGVK